MKKSLVILATILLGVSIVGCSSAKPQNNETLISTEGNNGTGVSQKEITVEEAKSIALADAGLTADQVVFYDVSTDIDDGRSKYEVEFYAANVEYDYEIDMKTGDIISSSIDK